MLSRHLRLFRLPHPSFSRLELTLVMLCEHGKLTDWASRQLQSKAYPGGLLSKDHKTIFTSSSPGTTVQGCQ